MAGGEPGWETSIKSNKVRAVIALEPGTFPLDSDYEKLRRRC